MDLFSAIYLGCIIFAFLAFGIALGYADYASRPARRTQELANTQVTAAKRTSDGQRKAA